MRPLGVKWIFVSDGGSGSRTDALIKRYLRIVECLEWHFTSYATVVTRFVPFPKPIRFVDRSNAGNVILLLCSGSFGCPSVVRLLVWLWVIVAVAISWSVVISSGDSSTFISAV